MNTAYNYTADSNNGKIASQTSNLAGGETVTYQYDSLNRLIAAAGSSGWGDSYGYDPFGNLSSKTVTAGSAPTLSQSANAAKNQVSGYSYDANGNAETSPSGLPLNYDAENRLVQAGYSSSYIQYAYDSQNKRIWSSPITSSGAQNAQVVYFYGVDGQQLGAYAGGSCTLESAVYFGSKRVSYGGGDTRCLPEPRRKRTVWALTEHTIRGGKRRAAPTRRTSGALRRTGAIRSPAWIMPTSAIIRM